MNRFLSLSILSLLLPALAVHAEETSVARVGLVIDGSDSLAGFEDQVLQAADRLLGQIESSPQKRWEHPRVQVFVVALDAIPTVVWTGSSAKLRALDRGALFARIRSRTDTRRCTDVTTAMRLALRELGPPGPTIGRHLAFFSDLIHEPPKTSARACARVVAVPADVPWDALKGVDVHALFLPPNQRLAWDRAAATAGLTSFYTYTTAESSQVTLVAPSPPTASAAEVETKRAAIRSETKTALGNAGSALLSVVLWAVGLLAALVLLGIVLGALRRRRPARFLNPQSARSGRTTGRS